MSYPHPRITWTAVLALLGIVAFLLVPVLSNAFVYAEDEEPPTEEAADETEEAPEVKLSWVRNVADAKAQAAKEGKDLLINFTGSNWCGWCIKLDDEVFSHAEFVTEAEKNFVFLYLDAPHGPERFPPQATEARKKAEEAVAAVVDAELNEKLFDEYECGGYPSIVLTTADGAPYGRTGYQPGGPAAYLEHLEGHRTEGAKIKALLADKTKKDMEVLKAAFPRLADQTFLGHPAFEGVLKRAESADPKDELGFKALIAAERERRAAKAEFAILKKIFDDLPEGADRPRAQMYEFIKSAKHTKGRMLVGLCYEIGQWLLKEQGKPAEAKALFERALQDDFAQQVPQAKSALEAMIKMCTEAIEGPAEDEDDGEDDGDEDTDGEGDDDEGDEDEDDEEDDDMG